MKFYRIKQISENQFTPQVAESLFDCLSSTWLHIHSRKDGEPHIRNYAKTTWLANDYWCICSTLEEAEQVINDYKLNLKQKSRHFNYYKFQTMIPDNILMWGIRILATMATLLGVGYVLNTSLDNTGVWQFICTSAICLALVIFIFDICIVAPLMCRIKAGKSTIFRDCPPKEPNYAPETKPVLPTKNLRKKPKTTNSKKRKPIKRK